MKLNENLRQFLFKDGLSQLNRFPAALEPGFIRIDEKTLENHLAYSYLYSDLISYYQESNQVAQQLGWKEFLETDETVILALIAETSTDSLAQALVGQVNELRKGLQTPEAFACFRNLVHTLDDLVLLINYWYTLLPETVELKQEIRKIIQANLAPKLADLYGIITGLESAFFQTKTRLRYEDFVSRLSLEKEIWYSSAQGDTETQHEAYSATSQVTGQLDELETLLEAFLEAIVYIKGRVPENLLLSLTSQTHQPHAALLLAFLKLLEYLQHSINQIPARLHDYYYTQVLQADRLKPKPDKAWVYFKLAEASTRFLLEQGTVLLADKDAGGLEHYYKTDKDLVVNKASIASIRSLLISNSHSGPGGAELKIYAAAAANTPDGQGLLPAGKNFSWAPFGEDQDPKEPRLRNMAEAMLGLVIASQVLQLESGKRRITLTFTFMPESFRQFTRQLEELIEKQFQEACQAESQERKREAFAADFKEQYFNDAFRIYVSGAEGWLELAPANIIPALTPHGIRISLVLGQAFPPVVSYDPALYPLHFDLHTAAVKICLNQKAQYNQYALLKELIVQRIHLAVVVSGYQRLILQNDIGPLEAGQPFQPFGPLPAVHNSLYVGSPEIFRKSPDKLRLRLTWQGLPEQAYGFQRYYAPYYPVQNQDFRVGISSLVQRVWVPQEKERRQRAPLFAWAPASADPPEALLPESRIDIDLERTPLAGSGTAADSPLLTNETNDGFIKLELLGPPPAFGHEAYPNVLSRILTHNANPKRQQLELPPKPYTPVLATIVADYRASAEIDLMDYHASQDKAQQVFQLYPFGHQQVFPQQEKRNIHFMTDFDEEGYLFIGLEQLPTPGVLAVLFHVQEHTTSSPGIANQLSWRYLADNRWEKFKDWEILSDTTDGLVRSGIVEFDIPARLSDENTVMPPGWYWLCGAVQKEATAFPRLAGIYTQAVGATFTHCTGGAPAAQTEGYQGLIRKVAANPPQIMGVWQPVPTRPGRPAESTRDFYTRISERLRHKGRAVGAWDYERLVLQEFPEVYKVKCINHASVQQAAGPSVSAPGHVLLVVIPRNQGWGEAQERSYARPQLSPYVLQDIKRYLRKKTSPVVQVEVINPVYEEIKISLDVKFEAGYDKGLYLTILHSELKKYLSPWLFNQQEEIKLSGELSASQLFSFINQLPYINRISHLVIYRFTEQQEVKRVLRYASYDSVIKPEYPWTVLVSANTHDLRVEVPGADPGIGIESMAIEQNFIVDAEVFRKNADINKPEETAGQKAEPPGGQNHFIIFKR